MTIDISGLVAPKKKPKGHCIDCESFVHPKLVRSVSKKRMIYVGTCKRLNIETPEHETCDDIIISKEKRQFYEYIDN